MGTALFFNGVYEDVFACILNRKGMKGTEEAFLQPHSGYVIRMLANRTPTPDSAIRLYASTTQHLSLVSYTAEIIRWEDKRKLSTSRRKEVGEYLEMYQAEELSLFHGTDQEIGDKPVNLLTVRELKRFDTPVPASLLRKTSDGLPLKSRTRAGGWSEVYDDIWALLDLPVETEETHEADLGQQVEKSRGLSDEKLRARLATAPKIPARVQVVSVGYRRNPDVIAAVLRRANGLCESCANRAPFTRRSDDSPYLEVHHRVPLSEGGEDTLANAEGLCPNCHREAHYG